MEVVTSQTEMEPSISVFEYPKTEDVRPLGHMALTFRPIFDVWSYTCICRNTAGCCFVKSL